MQYTSILQSLHQKYLQPFEQVLQRRALQYARLEEVDMFSLSEPEQQKHQKLLSMLADELVAMDNMRWVVTELIQASTPQTPPDDMVWARTQYERAVRTILTLDQVRESQQQDLQFFMDIAIRQAQQLKALNQKSND